MTIPFMPLNKFPFISNYLRSVVEAFSFFKRGWCDPIAYVEKLFEGQVCSKKLINNWLLLVIPWFGLFCLWSVLGLLITLVKIPYYPETLEIKQGVVTVNPSGFYDIEVDNQRYIIDIKQENYSSENIIVPATYFLTDQVVYFDGLKTNKKPLSKIEDSIHYLKNNKLKLFFYECFLHILMLVVFYAFIVWYPLFVGFVNAKIASFLFYKLSPNYKDFQPVAIFAGLIFIQFDMLSGIILSLFGLKLSDLGISLMFFFSTILLIILFSQIFRVSLRDMLFSKEVDFSICPYPRRNYYFGRELFVLFSIIIICFVESVPFNQGSASHSNGFIQQQGLADDVGANMLELHVNMMDQMMRMFQLQQHHNTMIDIIND